VYQGVWYIQNKGILAYLYPELETAILFFCHIIHVAKPLQPLELVNNNKLPTLFMAYDWHWYRWGWQLS